MDPKWKTALAVVVGVVIGMALLGTAVALPAALRAVGRHAVIAETAGYPMMGQAQGAIGTQEMLQRRQNMMGGQRPGMMGARGQGVAPGAEFGLQQDGTVVCPNCEACPDVPTEEAVPES